MSEQGFRGIPGIPDGWELVRIGRPDKDEYYLDGNNEVNQAEYCIYVYRPIVRKIQKQKQYRQFGNGEEFEPFRDRWFEREGAMCKVAQYDKHGIWIAGTNHFVSFSECCRSLKFDDGSPFGVEVTE